MEKHIKNLLTDNLLEKVTNLYCIEKEELKYIGGFENFIYEFEKNGSYIVRLTHSSHRTLEEVESEIDFLVFLADNNANVSTPIKSVNERLVEKVDLNDSYFIISAFTKAQGRRVSKDDLNDLFFYNYGKTIGNFHKLTKNYKISNNIKPRYSYYEDNIFINAKKYLKEEDLFVIDKLYETLNKISKINKNINNYGLIHSDIHTGNFLINDNLELSVFDFDDVSYQYFASDIAITIFYLTFFKDDLDRNNLIDKMLKPFMSGYLSENIIPLEDFITIPLFLKLREIVLYIVINRTLDIEKDEFAIKYIQIYRNRIKDNIEFLNIDLSKYY